MSSPIIPPHALIGFDEHGFYNKNPSARLGLRASPLKRSTRTVVLRCLAPGIRTERPLNLLSRALSLMCTKVLNLNIRYIQS